MGSKPKRATPAHDGHLLIEPRFDKSLERARNWQENILMRFSGMGGMLSNQPFSERAVVFDVAGGRFGVVRR